FTIERKRAMIDPADTQIPIRRQCELLGLHRSTLYYQPRGEDAFNERLMRLIDEQYVQTPFYGVEQMRLHLNRILAPQRVKINAKRVRRLMRLMGLEAIYPKPRLSLPDKAHRVYPYLLKDLTIDQPDQVWATDITYIPMHRGWVYLVAIMDWFSRYVLAWEVSTTLDASFCVDALKRALSLGTPEIFNSDQGSQFTSEAFTGVLREAGIAISMDGRGRVYDNIFVERLWRSVKYEEVYLHDYQTVAEAVSGLGRYFAFYNHERPHQAFNGLTPAEMYGLARPPWPIEINGQ
ncbi:MAG: IS3 family transposase, partial [Phycisphaerae bacterium]|nr:IS3 family transposase [Phycisphaerae bacterium]